MSRTAPLRRSAWVVALLLASACSPPLAREARALAPKAAAPTSTPAAPLSPSERSSAVAAIIAAIQESYVIPEKRAVIAEKIASSQKAGRYDVDDTATFAFRITGDLQEASGDHHLYVLDDPLQFAAAKRTAEKADGAGAPHDEPGEDTAAFERRHAQRDHHGIETMRILPGNLRYLKITGFEWVRDETGAAYDGAMRFLKGGDAVIVDLRGNGGGSASAVQYLVSHFLPEDTLEITFLEAGKPPTQTRSLEYLPAGRLIGKPLYVLIDNRVGSAAESFAYDVAQFKLGELVGETTAGAANNNKLLPIAPRFMVSVSFGRPVHAVSQSNWEGVGVAPTVKSDGGAALEVAESLALDRLAKAPGVAPEVLAEYAWAKVDVDAKLHPVALAASRVKALAGRFGDVEIAVAGGGLTLTRHDRPTFPKGVRLLPLSSQGADVLFAIDGVDGVRVRLTGEIAELQWQGDRPPRAFRRTR